MGALVGKSEATNKTNSSSNTTGNATNTLQSQVASESNANLANLGIRPYDFTGFRYGTTTYEVEVPEDTEKVEVYASAQAEEAKITGTGSKTLEKGENEAKVVVTAKDGTTKTYTINIIRGAKQKEEEDEKKEEITEELGNGLSKLKINDLKLSPEFKTNVYEYTVKYIGEDKKVKIEAAATNENYEIEIVGNDNLQEGENFITILVSEANGNNVATYQIKLSKSLVDEEAIAKEEASKKEKQQTILIGVGIVVVVVGAIIVGAIITHKRNQKLEREYAGIYSTRDDEKEEENEVPRALRQKEYQEEEIPRALRGKRFKEEIEEEEREQPYEKQSKKKEFQEIGKAFQEDKQEGIEEEEDFERMPKDEVKEKFLNGYTSRVDLDFNYDEGTRYQNNRRKAKHKGKRFK